MMRRYLVGLAGLAVISGMLIPATALAATAPGQLTAASAPTVALAPRAPGQPAAASAPSFATAPGRHWKSVRTLIGGPGARKAGLNANSSGTCRVGLLVGFDLLGNPQYGAPWGQGICGTYEKSFYSGSGSSFRAESFVLGADYAIWHTWTGESSWYTLEGQFCGFGYTDQPCGVFGSGWYPNITVGGYGPEGIQEWCNTRQVSGFWGGWYKCG